MRPSRREFVKWVTASGIALSMSRLGAAEETGFPARAVLPGRQGWNLFDPRQRHQHRVLCILFLHQADERHDPQQRHQHR